jgi:hypothetical protein
VGEFELERAGAVRASVSTYRKRLRLDLRLWVEPRDTPGSPLIPTKAGINVPAEYADELVEAAQALATAARQEQRSPRRVA